MHTLSLLKKDDNIVEIARNPQNYFLLVNKKQVAQIDCDDKPRIAQCVDYMRGLRAEGYVEIIQ